MSMAAMASRCVRRNSVQMLGATMLVGTDELVEVVDVGTVEVVVDDEVVDDTVEVVVDETVELVLGDVVTTVPAAIILT